MTTVAAEVPASATRRARLSSRTLAEDGGAVAATPRRTIFEGAAPSRIGMQFSGGLGFQQWLEIGRRLRAHHDASLWWLGDWLNHGKRVYGQRYKHGIAATGLEYQTLRNYAMVARRFELSRRRDNLSFQHHAELCALSDEEQDRWLDRAEKGRWSRNELRRRRRDEHPPRESTSSITLSVVVDSNRRARWRNAAEATGTRLEPWIVMTLDTAAAALLASM